MQLATISVKKTRSEPFWHVQLALIGATGLQLLVNPQLTYLSKYLIVVLELVLLVLISVPGLAAAAKRLLALALIGSIAAANISSLVLVINQLLNNGHVNGRQLLLSSVAIYVTNVILFGLLYWELDNSKQDEPDFSFPQFSDPAQKDWQPSFFDYLYIAITNATAFSPTDTLPLTHRAKLLMSLHATVSLATVALVAARAVNILG
jgi:uncharacterized membrane protein